MKNKTTIFLAGIALGLCVSIGFQSVAEVKPGDDSPTLMKRKLVHAQEILGALVLENFEEMEKHSRELGLISLEAQWKKRHAPEAYRQISSDFRYAMEKIEAMAKDEDTNGATLNYLQAVMSCVECHDLMRGQVETAGLYSFTQ